MKISHIFTLLCLCISVNLNAQQITNKPDFIQKNNKGEIITRGVYTTDDSGYVIRYDIKDVSNNRVSTTIPTYSNDGRLLEARVYDPKGKLFEVIVFIGDKMVGLTADGKKIDKYDNTTVDMKAFLDHFRNKSKL